MPRPRNIGTLNLPPEVVGILYDNYIFSVEALKATKDKKLRQITILLSRENPKIFGIDDAEVVGDGIPV